MSDENARRRSTARTAWEGQLTPEQRAGLVAAREEPVLPASAYAPAEGDQWVRAPDLVGVIKGGPRDLAARAKRHCQVDHPDEGDGVLWIPDEPRESLQRSLDRRG